MTLYTSTDLVGLLPRTLKRTHTDVSTMEMTALCWLVSQTRRPCPTTAIGEPSIEAPIIELEATSRAAERRSRANPARSRGEAREALRASERTQSNEPAPGGTPGARPGARAAPGRPRPGIALSPFCPRRRPAGDHRPRRFIAFFSAQISKGNTRLAYRDIAGPASRPTWVL